LYGCAPEESMIFNAFLPKILALVSAFEKELHGVLVISLKEYTSLKFGMWPL